MIKHFVCVLVIVAASILTTASVASASEAGSEVLALYRQAAETSRLVENLTSPILPNGLKQRVLQSARGEDSVAIKAMIAKWRPFDRHQVRSLFGEVIVTNEVGDDVLSVAPGPDNSGIVINGKRWNAPLKGSVITSLRQHLIVNKMPSHKKPTYGRSSASTGAPAWLISFAFGSGANAASPTVEDRLPLVAYSYYVESPSSTARSALQYTNDHEATEYLRSNKSAFRQFFARLLGLKPKLQCDGSTARGVAQIGEDTVSFESRGDGSLIVTMSDRTKLLVSSMKDDRAAQAKAAAEEISKFRSTGMKDVDLAHSILQRVRNVASTDSFDPLRAVVDSMDKEEGLHTKLPRKPVSDAAILKLAANSLDPLATRLNERKNEVVLHERVVVTECDSDDCTKLKPGPKTASILPYTDAAREAKLKRPKAAHFIPDVARAMEWKTDRETGRSLIEPADEIDSMNMTYPPRGVPGYFEGIALKRRAEFAMRTARILVDDPTYALRPLGQCCADSVCRATTLNPATVDVIDSKSSKRTTGQ